MNVDIISKLKKHRYQF